MTFRDLIFSIFGGLAVWLVQQVYLNRREQRKEQEISRRESIKEQEQRTIRAGNAERVITDDVFFDLAPSKSIALMKEMLGVPNKYRRTDSPVFSEEEVDTHSYLYVFKNAYVKVTSKDNESIDSLTVMPFDTSLSVEHFFFPCSGKSYKINEVIVCPELIEECRNHTFIQTRIDASFALEYYIPNPSYQSYTYFGYGPEGSFDYHESNDPKLFVGGVINGICVASSKEDSYFIYDLEAR